MLLISFFTALARCIEIILKPYIAHISDNSKFKMGRRQPFMLIGSVFYSIFLVLLFYPPSNSSAVTNSIWYGTFYVLFFVADTLSNIPYQALGPELSSDTNEREKMYVIYYAVQFIGVLFSSIAPVFIQKFLQECDCSYCNEISSDDIFSKQNCINSCQSVCSIKSNEKSLLYLSSFIGFFFVCTIVILVSYIKKKKESYQTEEKSYILPTLFRLINNKPFIRLIIPWIIDATIVQIFATMLPFFVSYVINPQKVCIEKNIDLTKDECNSTIWMGITICLFFLCCIFSMFIWHYLIGFIEKKKAWQSYSLMSIVTFALYLVCEEGSMILVIIFSIINSLPAGGGYLNDVFTSDAIDYDEFTTGKRNEGIYIVFSTFTPKLVGVFAQSIPLTIMTCILLINI